MQSIYLDGSEDVRRAASSMREAASEMNKAAYSVQSTFEQQRQYFDDFLQRLETIMRASA